MNQIHLEHYLTECLPFLMQHQGEGVAVVARAMGQLWSALSDDDRAVYQQKAAEERERVSKEIAKYNLDSFEVNAHKPLDPNSLVLPVARIRKISKLDPDVSGVSKEAAMLVTKCAELATVKLGIESVKVAQLQNRRKLLPEDVAQVCSTREQFLFLREDVRDLVRDQKDANEGNKSASGNASTAAAAASSRPLTAYFGPK
jgi:DNA-directed RNA polymerase I subunit RPA43